MGLVALQHVESSQTRDQAHVPYIGRHILNPWTTKESWVYFEIVTFLLFPAQKRRGFFLGLHSESLVGFLEVQLMKVCGPLYGWAAWSFSSQSSPHSSSSNLSRVSAYVCQPVYYSSTFCSRFYDLGHDSLNLPVSLVYMEVVCPVTSVL